MCFTEIIHKTDDKSKEFRITLIYGKTISSCRLSGWVEHKSLIFTPEAGLDVAVSTVVLNPVFASRCQNW